MKFYCDACNTKYAISDEKVRGKVLKVRCKNCGNIITVREAVAPIFGVDAQTDPTISTPTHVPTPEQLAVPQNNWYYALNGQTFGPFTLEGLRRKYATAEIGDATYVWHERLGSWRPVANEPAFANALTVGHKIVPSRKTLGFTGPVEAIRVVHGGPSQQREGAVPNTTHSGADSVKPQPKTQPKPKPEPRPKPKPKPEPSPKPKPKPEPRPKSKPQPKPGSKRPALPETAVPTPKPKPEPTAGKEATAEPLLKPKERPAISPDAESGPAKARPKPAPTPEARPIKDVRKSKLDRLRSQLDGEFGAEEKSAEEEELPKPVGGPAIFTYASGIVPASAESSQDIATARADDAFDFDLPPKAKPSKLSPSSTSDILEAVIGPTEGPPTELSEASEVDDSGVIPFYPEAPKLPSQIQGATGQEATSESLMLDVDRMNRSKRSKGIAAAGIGIVALVAVISVGAFIAFTAGDEATVTPPEAGVGEVTQPEHKDDLEIRTYKKDELGELATMNLGEELLFEEGDTESMEEPAESIEAAEPSKTGSKGAATKPPKPKSTDSNERRTPKPDKKPTKVEVKTQKTEEPIEKVDPLTALLQPRAHKTTEINAPEDKLLTKRSEGLTKDQARRGFRKVRKSIAQCRERHNRYNAALGVGKLKISVTVDPTGEVSTFSIAPRKVENTEFHNCMRSHRTRWRFAAFDGKPVVINTSVIIQ